MIAGSRMLILNIADPSGRQLNKGEHLHNLRRFLIFANEGEIRRSQFEDPAQVLFLNLAADAIITWNTVYMAEALGATRSDGIAVDDDNPTRIPQTLWPLHQRIWHVRVRP
jgi:hypothetical protein